MEALGARMAEVCRGGAVVHLSGALGAGKTTLVRGLLRALGHTGTVKSPTYTLMESYELGPLTVAHVDLYRIRAGAELDYLDLRERMQPGALCLIEWPERGADYLPAPDLHVRIDYTEHARRVTLHAATPHGAALLEAL